MPTNTLPRNKRLDQAEQWVAQYSGQHILSGYRKRFKVDLLTAIQDLFLLGVIDQEKRDLLTKQELARQSAVHIRREEKKKAEQAALHADQDERFYYIAGYTSGGFPYGITWEEMRLEPWEEKTDER